MIHVKSVNGIKVGREWNKGKNSMRIHSRDLASPLHFVKLKLLF